MHANSVQRGNDRTNTMMKEDKIDNGSSGNAGNIDQGKLYVDPTLNIGGGGVAI